MLGPILEGTYVRLEPPKPTHLGRFVDWFADREVTRYLLRRFPPSLRQEERWLEQMADSETDIVWAVVLRATGTLAGVMALHRIDWRHRHGWIEITLGERSAWGQGYGTEAARLCTAYAFDELGLEKVLASVYSGNDASLAILGRLGYAQSGRLRRHAFLAGAWHDEWLGEILVDEWRRSRRARREAVMDAPAPMPTTLDTLARSLDRHPDVVQRLVPLLRGSQHPFRDKVDLALELLGGVVPDWPLLSDWNRWCLQSGARFFVWEPEREELSERTRLEALVHTVMMIASKEQAIGDYLAAGVRAVEITLAGDDCAVCDPHRHRVVPLSDRPVDALPPFHPGCRCGFLPRLD